MDFYRYELNPTGDAYEIVLYLRSTSSLEEFAEEFGLSYKTEEDINRVAIDYVDRKFPTLSVNSIKIMLGGALLTTILIGGAEKSFAQEQDTQNGPSNATNNIADTKNLNRDEITHVNTPPQGQTSMKFQGDMPRQYLDFIELVAEKIQLALTFEDTERAEAITKFANEKMAEINLLFEQGKNENAVELLKNSLERKELTLHYATKSDSHEETALDEVYPIPEELEGITPQGEQENGEDELAVNEEKIDRLRNEIQDQFSNNITSLLLSLQRVEDPTYKEILAKNVEREFSRLERKLEKVVALESRFNKVSEITGPIYEIEKDIQTDQGEFERDMKENKQ